MKVLEFCIVKVLTGDLILQHKTLDRVQKQSKLSTLFGEIDEVKWSLTISGRRMSEGSVSQHGLQNILGNYLLRGQF